MGIGGHDLLKMVYDGKAEWDLLQFQYPVEIHGLNYYYHHYLEDQGYSTGFIVIIRRIIANEKI